MSPSNRKQLTRAELQDEITRRSMNDPDFRDAVIADPQGALAEAFGLDLPESVQIRVVVDSPDTSHIVVPAEPKSPASEDELEDQALDDVTGGLLQLSAHAGHTPD